MARIIVIVDGNTIELTEFDIQNLLGALRRDARAEENRLEMHVDDFGLEHRMNVGHDRALLELLQPKHSRRQIIPEPRTEGECSYNLYHRRASDRRPIHRKLEKVQ